MTERVISMAYSPCPNDTYQFSAIARGELALPGVRFDIQLLDIEQLNRAALAQTYDILKLSFPAWLAVRGHYALLDAGAALGFGCGPLLLSREPRSLQSLADCRVLFPGEHTTAYLLFRLLGIATGAQEFVRYDEIVPRLQAGEADCGVVIHESRFTYADAGLHCLLDLGQWWEHETGLPVPLGGLAMRRSLGDGLRQSFERLLRDSIALARSRPLQDDGYVRRHAQEFDPAVLERHVGLYVNDFSLGLGSLGRRAVDTLAVRAAALGLAA